MTDSIQYSNIKRIDALDFDIYKKMPGYSFSFLKNEDFGRAQEVNETFKIKVGKIVDAILTEDGNVDMMCEEYAIARSIAIKIKEKFGAYIKHFHKQPSFVADLNYQNLVMPSRGRLDYLLPRLAVVDLKVTFEKNWKGLIKYMRYEDQQWNYANMAEVKRKYIMIHSVPLGTTEMVDLGVVTPRNEFWESKVLKFGIPAHEYSSSNTGI